MFMPQIKAEVKCNIYIFAISKTDGLPDESDDTTGAFFEVGTFLFRGFPGGATGARASNPGSAVALHGSLD
jgi:hypothetical protein